MRISKKNLTSVIRRVLLEDDEFDASGISDVDDDSVYTTKNLTGRNPEIEHWLSPEEAQLYAEIAAGFTPVGVAVDAKDIAVALHNRDFWGATFALASIVPGIGEIRKLKKLKELQDLKKNVENIKKVNPSKLEYSIKKAQKATSSAGTTRKLTNIAELGFKVFKPENRHFTLIHGSGYKNLNIEPLKGRSTRQSKKGKSLAGFYTLPQHQTNLPDRSDTINRAKRYVKDSASSNPAIDSAYIHEIKVRPNTNFVEQIKPNMMGMTRITPEAAAKYKEAGIDVIVSKSMGLEEVIILNRDIIVSKTVSVEKIK